MAKTSKEILVSQRKSVETLMDLNTKLMSQTEELAMDKGQYQRLVGKLIYLTLWL